MHELQQVLQHDDRIGAAFVKRRHLRERIRRRRRASAALEQVEDQAAVGDAEHVAHRASAIAAPDSAIAWSRIESPSRTEPSAARAISGDRRWLGGDAFGLATLAIMLGQQARPARGAARSAGSATAR